MALRYRRIDRAVPAVRRFTGPLAAAWLAAAAAVGEGLAAEELRDAAAPPEVSARELYQRVRTRRGLLRAEGLDRVQWTPDGGAYYIFEEKTFVRVDAATGEKRPLFDDAKIIAAYNALAREQAAELPFRRFRFLEGGRKIRFEASGRAFLYELSTGEMVSYRPEKPTTGVRGHRYEEVLSPDSKLRAFVRAWDLYVRDLEERETALTSDGHEDLRNGYPDWVYAEELDQYEAFWWSPDSRRIAYLQFDESPVARYPIVDDVGPIPRLELQRYPKAGANNPIVRIFIADVRTGKKVRVDAGIETNVYLYRGRWTPDGKSFTYLRLSRRQDAVELLAADPETGRSRLVLRDEDPCYIDYTIDRVFLPSGGRLLWLSDRTGWREIYLYDLEGNLHSQITDAKLPVDEVLGADEEGGWVYFTGFETRGTEKHLYRARLDGKGFQKLTWRPGTHRISLAPGCRYYVDTYTSFDVPSRTTLHRADGSEIRELGRTDVTRDFLDLRLLDPERFTFRSADGEHDLDAVLFKPARFDGRSKYPLILSVYGGPGAKMVRNSFGKLDGDQALAQLGYLVAITDHRGASGRGKAFQNLGYKKLGQVELEDHVALVRHLAARPYVDAERVGIWGHSYGGYLTCLALLKEPDVFHVGVAGAPVTDWRNYDTIYTERYMGLPEENPEAYELGSCLRYAKNLKGKLAIHHGAIDDNVHLGNSVQLIRALLRENKRFDFMLYPGDDHGIGYPRYDEARLEYFELHLRPEALGPGELRREALRRSRSF